MANNLQCSLGSNSIQKKLVQADQRLKKIKEVDIKIFCLNGEIQTCLDNIEDGLWRGRKITGWNTYIFPSSVADNETLKALRLTYRTWLRIYREIGQELKDLHNFYSNTTDCKTQQFCCGSLIYQLELGTGRLVDFCTTARTGIPFCAWVNRNAIRCLDL
jgi:hypothetical protein